MEPHSPAHPGARLIEPRAQEFGEEEPRLLCSWACSSTWLCMRLPKMARSSADDMSSARERVIRSHDLEGSGHVIGSHVLCERARDRGVVPGLGLLCVRARVMGPRGGGPT
eukprot:2865725-Prymnesium_polylepis.1